MDKNYKNILIGFSIAPLRWKLSAYFEKEYGDFEIQLGPFILGGQWK